MKVVPVFRRVAKNRSRAFAAALCVTTCCPLVALAEVEAPPPNSTHIDVANGNLDVAGENVDLSGPGFEGGENPDVAVVPAIVPPLAGLGGYSTAILRQTGDRNSAEISQWGQGNDVALDQVGTGNAATVAQAGFGNQLNLSQTGNGLLIGIRQRGVGAHVTVRQSR